jgi:hypothetical protein
MRILESPAIGVLIAVGLICYLAAFGLHLFMVWKANRGLPEDDQLPYSLQIKGWNRVAKEYNRFYPRSQVYPLAVSCAFVVLILSLVIFIARFWRYFSGK